MDLLDIFNKAPNEERLRALTGNKKLDNPTLAEIIDLLQRAKNVPNINLELMAENNGSYRPFGNQLTLNPLGGMNPNTVTHEFNHALDWTMAHEAYQRQNQRPFFNNFGQDITLGEQFGLGYRGFQKRSPLQHDDEYRGKTSEAQAFGVGNYAEPKRGRPGQGVPLHLDATMATEQAILRDLFNRYLKQNPK